MEEKLYTLTVQSEDDNKGTVDTSVNGAYIGGSPITLTATPEEGYKLSGWYINDEKIVLGAGNTYTVTEDGEVNITIIAKFAEKPQTIAESQSCVGYYIKNPADNEYAIIYADRLAQAGTTVTWNSTNNSRCTFPTLTDEEKEEFKTYVMSNNTYTDSKFGTKNVITLSGDNEGTEERFMAMALSDFSTKLYSWYSNAKENTAISGLTDTEFNTGKDNTEKMIDKWNKKEFGEKNGNSSYPDVWGAIQGKVEKGWFLPSKDEWSACAYGLRLGQNFPNWNYNEDGEYFSSSLYPTTPRAWRTRIDKSTGSGHMELAKLGVETVQDFGAIRLSIMY